MPISKNSVSIAGEFLILSELALRGLDANMTLGRTKSVDILVANPDTKKMYKVEVKTNTTRPYTTKMFGLNYEWIMNEKHETIIDSSLYYCFVALNEKRIFVVPSREVAKHVKEQHKYWQRKTGNKNPKNKMWLFRIGLEKDSRGLPFAKYEGKFTYFNR